MYGRGNHSSCMIERDGHSTPFLLRVDQPTNPASISRMLKRGVGDFNEEPAQPVDMDSILQVAKSVARKETPGIERGGPIGGVVRFPFPTKARKLLSTNKIVQVQNR
jgi:hypothetical protein